MKIDILSEDPSSVCLSIVLAVTINFSPKIFRSKRRFSLIVSVGESSDNFCDFLHL